MGIYIYNFTRPFPKIGMSLTPKSSSSFSSLILSASRDKGFSVSSNALEDPRCLLTGFS
jgi:hypothetical protein